MRIVLKAVAAFAIAAIFASGSGFAQHHDHDGHHDNRGHYDNHRYVHHSNWRRGARMDRRDWDRGERIDYRRYHLHVPPRGYEWREVDGNYVLAAVATGLIASVIAASAASH